MQDNTNTVPADTTTMTTPPVVNVANVTNVTPAPVMEAPVVTETSVQVGPDPVTIPVEEVKVELPAVPAATV